MKFKKKIYSQTWLNDINYFLSLSRSIIVYFTFKLLVEQKKIMQSWKKICVGWGYKKLNQKKNSLFVYLLEKIIFLWENVIL